MRRMIDIYGSIAHELTGGNGLAVLLCPEAFVAVVLERFQIVHGIRVVRNALPDADLAHL